MKKTLFALGLAGVLVGAQVSTAEARGHGDPVLGAVIGGIVAGAVIADTFAPHPVYYAPAPQPVYYCPPPAQVVYAPVCEPAPVVVYREPFMRFGFGYGYGHGYRHDRYDRHEHWGHYYRR